MKTLDNNTITAEIEQLALRLLAPPKWKFWRRSERAVILARLRRASLAKSVLQSTMQMWLTELRAEKPWSAERIMSAREAVRK